MSLKPIRRFGAAVVARLETTAAVFGWHDKQRHVDRDCTARDHSVCIEIEARQYVWSSALMDLRGPSCGGNEVNSVN